MMQPKELLEVMSHEIEFAPPEHRRELIEAKRALWRAVRDLEIAMREAQVIRRRILGP